MEQDLNDIWQKLVDKLESSLSSQNMNMYIRQLEPVSIKDGTLTACVTSMTLKNSIEHKFMPVMQSILQEITEDAEFSLAIEVAKKEGQELEVPKESYEATALFPEKGAREKEPFASNLNPKQTFDTFVIGNSNRFARAAAMAVSKEPGSTYNPLFIYGNSGLGKTHLMHAIGNNILHNFPGAKVKYVTSEIFTNEIINAIQNHTVKSFQEKYRSIDCLIIDDIQFLEKKERTQEEFFHTFNALKEANKQIVISSDRHPREMDMLEERLRTRFVNGLTADIQAPDLETRIAIISKKAELENVEIPMDVIQIIAQNIENNVRMIEGAFTSILAYSELMHQPIDMKMAQKILKDFGAQQKKSVTQHAIATVICEEFGLKMEDLMGKKRSKNIAEPRQIAMYLCRNLTDTSLPKIGTFFGGRDHSTVIHACEKVEKLRKDENSFDAMIKRLEEKVQNL